MRCRTGFVLMAALAATTAFASETTRQAMDRLTKEFDGAMKRKDMAWFDKISAPDYFEVGAKGMKMNRGQAMAEMKQTFQMGAVTESKSRVIGTQEKGGKVIAITETNVTMSMMPPGAKKASIMKSLGRYEEVWTHTAGKDDSWRIHSIKTLKETITVDGKPFSGGM